MTKKILIVSLLLGLIATSCNRVADNKPANEVAIPQPGTLENFQSQSAKEVENPQQGSPAPKQDSTAPNKTASVPAHPPCSNGDSQNFECYAQYYKNLVETQGVPAAFTSLRAEYDLNAYVSAQCHPLAHVIGQAAVEKYPTVAEAYTHGDSFCWSGYYHGVLEGVVARIGRQKVPGALNTICDGIVGKASYSFDYYNCVHGLGHGVMAFTNDELFDSLKLCDKINGDWEKSSCYSGVFMENVIVDNKNHFTKYLNPADPLYPCDAVDAKYKSTCYLMQTSYMLKVTTGNFKKVFELCSGVEDAYRSTCYQSLGRDASGRSSSNVTTTKNTCELGKNFEQQSNCVIGAVKDFISYFHSDTQAKQLCNALAADLQTLCLTTTDSYYKSF
ncbi:MAG: hypothetical protein WDN47_03140 [Candidatus Doudnabacteria bacterium]